MRPDSAPPAAPARAKAAPPLTLVNDDTATRRAPPVAAPAAAPVAAPAIALDAAESSL